jgi:2-oxoglutarate dehydrogenase complex dehydrogenase (E1) component-like enzyme
MSQHSIIGNISPELMDEMYHKYLNNPDSVDGSWKQFFLKLQKHCSKFHERLIHLNTNVGFSNQCKKTVILFFFINK